ncbi:MAG TPA: right-handed parallel beta-helix repeat-containing protein [Firmicutes bacterium]|nr:right-handed parallel beta-helix repeat-containing protein [Bacillota bacterium]
MLSSKTVTRWYGGVLVSLFLVLCLTGQTNASGVVSMDDFTPAQLALLGIREPSFNAVMMELLVEVAKVKNASKVVLPPGVHRIDQPIHLRNVENLTIDGQGATFIFTSHEAGLRISNATNLTLRNLVIDYDPLPFTQGVIIGSEPSGKWYDVRIDAGYPKDDQLLSQFRQYALDMIVMDPQTRAIKKGTPNFKRTYQIERIADDVLRLWFPNQAKNTYIVEGDRVVLEYRNENPAINLNGVQDSLFENITIHSSPHMGILELSGGGGNTYRNIQITPGPIPAGAVAERLFSVNADAFHSGAMERGPVLEDCLFEMMGDDAINIKGSFVYVVGAIDDELILASRKSGSIPAQVGDTLQLVNASTLEILGQVQLLELTPVVDADLLAKARSLWQNIKGSPPSPGVYRARVDTPVALKPGDLAVSLSRSGAGAIVRNCTIRGNRARGMLIKSPGVLIENNTLESISLAGITIMPETEWMEGPIPFDVVIRGNVLKNMGVSDLGHLLQIPHGGSAIAVLINDRGRAPKDSQGIRNVVIEDNVIENPTCAAITLYNITEAVVRNNHITQGSGDSIRIFYSDQVELENNTVNGVPFQMHSPQKDDNLVERGDFEAYVAGRAPDNWELWERERGMATMWIDDSTAHSGEKSLLVVNTDTQDWSVHYPGIPDRKTTEPLYIGPNQALYVSVALRIEGEPGITGGLDIQLHSSLDEEPQTRSYLVPAGVKFQGNTDWIVLEDVVFTRPDTLCLRVRLSGKGTGKIWFDDVVVRPLDL